MWALQVSALGQPLQLDLVERARPKPGHGDVLVRLKAAALNYRDLSLTRGASTNAAKPPFTPFSDGCGIVEELGLGVTQFKIGDRVCSTFLPEWISGEVNDTSRRVLVGLAGDFGVGQEFFVFPARSLVRPPDFLSDTEAATLVCAGVTAWRATQETARLRAGDTVLLQGTGGVSIFALQFAKAAGYRAIVTSSSDEKLKRARSLGADETINYRRTPEWSDEVLRLTGGRGVDLVVEVTGALRQSMRAARIGGAIATIGILGNNAEQSIDGRTIYTRNLIVHGVTVGSRAMFEAMNRAVEAHRIKPVISESFSWRDACKAYEAMSSGTHFGKIVISAD
jgi:NADPH:quinone reductase-like Zn-dependent oxidoreductase